MLRPGGRMAVTVPTRWPERVCWALDHRLPRHARAATSASTASTSWKQKLESAGLWLRGSHHAHALHSPYWWLKCAVGRRQRRLAAGAHATTTSSAWQITDAARGGSARVDRALNPVLGKSLVVYTREGGLMPRAELPRGAAA